jgi:hypothetical protein
MLVKEWELYNVGGIYWNYLGWENFKVRGFVPCITSEFQEAECRTFILLIILVHAATPSHKRKNNIQNYPRRREATLGTVKADVTSRKSRVHSRNKGNIVLEIRNTFEVFLREINRVSFGSLKLGLAILTTCRLILGRRRRQGHFKDCCSKSKWLFIWGILWFVICPGFEPRLAQ